MFGSGICTVLPVDASVTVWTSCLTGSPVIGSSTVTTSIVALGWFIFCRALFAFLFDEEGGTARISQSSTIAEKRRRKMQCFVTQI